MLKINIPYYALFILCSLFSNASFGQELVSNGDFETYENCPNYYSQIDYADGWKRPTDATSDYFNACNSNLWTVSVPENFFGNQAANSGDGYAGFYAFHSFGPFSTVDDDDREYINTTLTESMKIGESYSVEYYVSLSDGSKYGVDELGLLFSTAEPTRIDELPITLIPQIIFIDEVELTIKEGWTKISACFVADSAYQYLTIGNFNTGVNTNAIFVGSQLDIMHYAYYYVDDVSVVKIEKPELVFENSVCDPILVEVSNYTVSDIFEWSTGESANSILVENSSLIWASISSNGCTLISDTVSIEITDDFSFTLGQDRYVDFCKTEHFLLKALDYDNENASYTWSNGETSPEILITSPGSYSLSISDEGGCYSEDQITIKDVCESTLYLPNSFTPNGDGRNDTFYIKGHYIHLLSFSIFDRWGKKVFESSDISVAWEAIDYPDGVYVWKVEYHKGDGEGFISKIGSVLVLK